MARRSLRLFVIASLFGLLSGFAKAEVTSLDLRAAYCAGVMRATPSGNNSLVTNEINRVRQHVVRYLVARGYLSLDATENPEQMMQILIPLSTGMQDERALATGRSYFKQCMEPCYENIKPSGKKDLNRMFSRLYQCVHGCDKYQTDAEKKVTSCLDIEKELPF